MDNILPPFLVGKLHFQYIHWLLQVFKRKSGGTTVQELNIQYCTIVKKVNYEESLCIDELSIDMNT